MAEGLPFGIKVRDLVGFLLKGLAAKEEAYHTVYPPQ